LLLLLLVAAATTTPAAAGTAAAVLRAALSSLSRYFLPSAPSQPPQLSVVEEYAGRLSGLSHAGLELTAPRNNNAERMT
jgi:hypothetical protein